MKKYGKRKLETMGLEERPQDTSSTLKDRRTRRQCCNADNRRDGVRIVMSYVTYKGGGYVKLTQPKFRVPGALPGIHKLRSSDFLGPRDLNINRACPRS
jgi:hypothetical protein